MGKEQVLFKRNGKDPEPWGAIVEPPYAVLSIRLCLLQKGIDKAGNPGSWRGVSETFGRGLRLWEYWETTG